MRHSPDWLDFTNQDFDLVVTETEPPMDDNWVRDARPLVADLMVRRPALYWLDFALSAAAAWLFAAIYFVSMPFSAVQIAALLLAGIAFFRAGTFMHEIVHMRRGEMGGFKFAWNALIGIPLLMPWLLYRNHMEHHSRADFGTPRDGEYLPLAASPIGETFKYLLQIPLLPVLAVIRFGVLGPVSHLHPRWRDWVLERASAYITNPYYRRRFPAQHQAALRRVEWCCFAWLAALAALTLAGIIAPAHWLMGWVLLATALGLNWLRNLAAHGYANRGDEMSQQAQIQDSINLSGQHWLALWLFPVGLRYHALHHVFPALPYHNLGTAHRRLMAALPANSPYRLVNRDNYFAVVGTLLRGALATSRGNSPIPQWRTQPVADRA
jgi:fatty acid desaturase